MALSGSSSGGGLVRSTRASEPAIDRSTAFIGPVPRVAPPESRARMRGTYRGKISVVAIATIFVCAFVAVVLSYAVPVASYTPHDPIVVDSDDDFDSADFLSGGDGSSGDPWIISGYEIVPSTGGVGISISGTTEYFVISGIYIHTSDWIDMGIHLSGVSNAVVTDTDIDHALTGILVDYSDNIAITSCYMIDCEVAVKCDHVTDVVVSDNELVDGPNFNCPEGVFFSTVSYGEVSHNTISFFTNFGIHSYDSDNVDYSSNEVSDIGDKGILLEVDEACTVYDNVLRDNYASGVFLATCTGVTVYHNSFFGNGPDQAHDMDGTGNLWDAGPTTGGNYWDDYTGTDGSDADLFGDTPYVIGGDSLSEDEYPLMSSPQETPIPEFSSVAVPVLAVMILFLIAVRRRSS